MKILHADDHALFREGVHHILKQWDADLAFLEANSIDKLADFVARHHDIDLVLIDLSLKGTPTLPNLNLIWKQNPGVPVVILAASEDPQHMQQALAAGAAGYIPKSSSLQTLLNGLTLVMEGGIYAPRTAYQRSSQAPALSLENPAQQLTKRQSQVLALMAEGLPNKLIARKLFVSEATVKGHVTAILSSLGVENRVQAINRARQIGQNVGTLMGLAAVPLYE